MEDDAAYFTTGWLDFSPHAQVRSPCSSCSVCGSQVPALEEILAPWACSCGSLEVLPLADLEVRMTIRDICRQARRFRPLGLSAAVLFTGREPWAVYRALKEEPRLVPLIFCLN